MEKRGASQLFLLPVYQDKEYEPSAEYYGKVCWPISQMTDIPVGQRACRMRPLMCPECEARAVLVVDFLFVRGQGVPEKIVVCDYAPMAGLFSGAHPRASHMASAAQSFEHEESIGSGRR